MIADKVYILYLEEDKKERMQKRLENFPIPYEFVKGADGRRDDFIDWLDKKNYHIMKDYVVSDEEHAKTDRAKVGLDNWYRKGITTGEVGCGLGHWYMWKKAKKDGVEKALFLEDDAMIGESMSVTNDSGGIWVNYDKDNMQLINIIKYLDYAEEYDWDLLYLGFDGVWANRDYTTRHILEKPLMKKVSKYIAKVNFAYNLHAYIVTNKGIDILLNNNFENNLCVADEYVPALYGNDKYSLNHPQLNYLNGQMKAYATIPMLIDQEDKGISGSLTTETGVIESFK